MTGAQVVYQHVPPEVIGVSVYAWRAGQPPVPLTVPVTRDGRKVVIALPSSEAVVVLRGAQDAGYLVDGPILPRDEGSEIVERTIDATWRRTIRGAAERPPDSAPLLDWVPAAGADSGAWPACWWTDAVRWECMGVPLDGAGVVVGLDGDGLLSAIVPGRTTPMLRGSRWGRLVRVADRGSGPPPRLRLAAARPVPSSARVRALRLETVPVADVRISVVAASVYWVAGNSSPPDAWLEIRSARSGPQFLSLAGIASGSPRLPVDATLADRRDVAISIVSARGEPARGALVTAFRLIDAQPGDAAREQPPPRRVLAGDAVADGDGAAEIDGLGEADYEIVAWHPQFGRGSARLDPVATQVALQLRAPGIARGRVVVNGKAAGGVEVISVPDPSAYVRAADPIDLKGGDARTAADGRFWVALAAEGGGELRVGGGDYPIVRVPLPRGSAPVVELGDIELGRPLVIQVTLDQDPGCDVRATGPVGRSGLQIVAATRTGPGLFTVTLPEEGTWEFGLLCGRTEGALMPAFVRISAREGPREVRLTVR